MARDTAGSISAAAGRRWQAIDPLLPAPSVLPGCGAGLVVTGADGRPIAAGGCEHWEGAPDSLEPSWGAARRFQLTAAITVPDVADALNRLLSLWRDHLARVPGTDGADTAATVTWPSRDIRAVPALLRHGLVPVEVIAARAGRGPAGRTAGRPPRADGGARYSEPAADKAGRGLWIRRATLADSDVVARLGLEVIRFDAHFGKVIERPGTAAAMRREAARLLAGPQAWTWLAERDGIAVGMVSAERPESAGWIAPMVRAAPVAYLELMYTLPGERGRGIGAALVAALHRDIDAASAAVTLLHYEQVNPLSVPFWSQQGYRPLWTTWEARPARGIR